MITWFKDPIEYARAVDTLRAVVVADETILAGRAFMNGWCLWCNRATIFRVPSGATFGDRPNLREGMQCSRCKLTNRQRLVACAIAEHVTRSDTKIALLEQTTRLYRALKHRFPRTTGSEYLGLGKESGRPYFWRSSRFRLRYTRHEDLTHMSSPPNSFDLIVHSDVLEHVYDYRVALRECYRVLSPGGTLLFTVPFFHERAVSLLRGRPCSDGSLIHFAPPEYHGDGVAETGIYTFHSFGRDLIDEIHAAGFCRAAIGLSYSPKEGFVSANAADANYDMLPIVFQGIKSG